MRPGQTPHQPALSPHENILSRSYLRPFHFDDMTPQTLTDFLAQIECVPARSRANAYAHFKLKRIPDEWINEAMKKYPVGIGLGDVVATVATPIGRAIHWPCVDPKTQKLKPKSWCQKAKEKLNEFRL